MTNRRRNSAKCRRIVIEHHSFTNPAGRLVLRCHVGGEIIDVVKEPKRWEADHIRRWSEGGEDTPENLRPLCSDCAAKKNPADTRDIAHGKRYGDKHLGVRVSKGWSRW